MTGLLRPGDEEVIVTALPLYHVFALMVNFITFFSIGTTNWLVANPRDMDGLVEIFKQAHPSVFMGVNTLYAGLVAHPRFRELDFSNLKPCGGGGAAVIAATSAKWKEITGTFNSRGPWPVGNRTCADVQPGVHQRVQWLDRSTGAVDRHQAARRRGSRGRNR
jgi:long-chain acyl-CoA synthetase